MEVMLIWTSIVLIICFLGYVLEKKWSTVGATILLITGIYILTASIAFNIRNPQCNEWWQFNNPIPVLEFQVVEECQCWNKKPVKP